MAGLKIKRLSDVLAEMINRTSVDTSQITDYSAGSAVRSIFEAVAIQLDDLFMLTKQNINFGIDEGVMTAFGFEQRDAQRAYGNVTLHFYSPLPQDTYFYKGMVATNPSLTLTFQTENDYIAYAGDTDLTIPFYCTTPGTVGNIPMGTLTSLTTSVATVSSISQDEDFLTGTDGEDIDDVRSRFRLFVEANGRATIKALEYGIRQHEEVTGVYLSEQKGLVTAYVHDSNGDLTTDLANKIQLSLDTDWRPAGVEVDIEPVSKIAVDLNITVVYRDLSYATDTILDGLITTVRTYLNQFTAAEDVVLSDIVRLVMNYDTNNIIDCYVKRPSSTYLQEQVDNANTLYADTQASVADIKQLINVAQTDTSAKMLEMNKLVDDYVLTDTEKAQVKDYMTYVDTVYTSDNELLTDFPLDDTLNYANAYSEFTRILKPLVNSTVDSLQVDRSDFQKVVTTFFNTRVDFLYSVYAEGQNQLDDISTMITNANSALDNYTQGNIITDPEQIVRAGVINITAQDQYDSGLDDFS